MKCPDCGTRLSEVMSSAGIIMRCYKCGGFWIDSWAANRLSNAELQKWRRISISSNWVSGGKGVCPADATMLTRYTGESVPVTITTKRCVRCGKWWFPGDSLFEYKPAIEIKINYFRQWGKSADLASLALPIVAVIVLMIGTVFGVKLVQQKQEQSIQASEGIKDFTAAYQGDGKVLIMFKSTRKIINSVEIKQVNGLTWTTAPTFYKDGLFMATVSGLKDGEDYTVRIEAKEFIFTAK